MRAGKGTCFRFWEISNIPKSYDLVLEITLFRYFIYFGVINKKELVKKTYTVNLGIIAAM